MSDFLFLGDSITDAGHLFDPANLGNGYVSMLAVDMRFFNCVFQNRGHDGFTTEQVLHMLNRDGIERNWDVITLLVGVNDIPVELYTSRKRIPDEFAYYYEEILRFLITHTDAQLILAEPFLFDHPLEYKSWHPYIEAESKIIETLADKYHACFLPTDHILRQSAEEMGIDRITPDGIHLTYTGNQILADLWRRAYLEMPR